MLNYKLVTILRHTAYIAKKSIIIKAHFPLHNGTVTVTPLCCAGTFEIGIFLNVNWRILVQDVGSGSSRK